jgi:hypothetical protein
MGSVMTMPENAKKLQNPVLCKEGRGFRNFACQFYDFCLDKAAKGMWSGFTCKQCDWYQQREDGGL